MINHSTGAANVLLGCTAAALDTVVTSREFIARARLEALEAALAAKMKLIYLEDVRQTIGARDKLYGLVAAWRPLRFSTRRVPSSDAGGSRRKGRQMRAITPADPAVVLFTSGSEGAPKGVVHSHRSLLANCAQVASVIDFSPADTLFNAMPVFHSFGFTGGLLLPLVSGVPSFQYPSPLHYRIVPELIYDQNATIMFGTDSFLKGYARAAHPYDLYAIRYIIAGAEKVQDETRRVYMEKFQKAIYEGYGATETAPVLSLNTPMHFRLGTAGRLLPAIEHRIEAIAGIAEGGRLHVRGPNVMLGYLRVDRPGVIEPPEGGEYDTGDIVAIDAEGYVTIKDRAKRISKIAGEMVSHQAVEAMAAALWPDAAHAVLGVPDERRGEQLVLVTTEPHATRQALSAFARERGKTELMVPRSVLVRERLPILGTGKTDYVALREMVLAGAAAPEASLAETP
jgi:acyl-[acyl-carrier-protein]-phospholipid O-acyltransferase/long-chain-fatty-acid--[acyl-carrier-protein] ligase